MVLLLLFKGERGKGRNETIDDKRVEEAISKSNILRFWATWDMVPVGVQRFDIAPYEHIGTSLMVEMDGGIIGYFLNNILKDNELATDPIIDAHSIDEYKIKQLIPLYLYNKYPEYQGIVKVINKNVRGIILTMMGSLLPKSTRFPMNDISKITFPIYSTKNINRK